MSRLSNGGLHLNRRRFLQGGLALGGGVVGLDALSACSSTGNNTTSSNVTATVGWAPPTTQPGQLYIFNEGVKDFEAAYPGEKIKGVVQGYDPATYLTKLAANQTPTVMGCFFTEPPLLIPKHAMRDITTLAKGWTHFKDYDPRYVKIVSDSAGRVYGLPDGAYQMCICYNRKLFKAAGLDPDKPPTTWDEFRSYAKRLTSSSVAGFFQPLAGALGGWFLTAWTYAAGGLMESEDGKKALFNSPQTLSALQLFHDMRFVDHSMLEEVNTTMNVDHQLLANGKLAMVLEQPYIVAALKQTYPDLDMNDFGLCPVPQNGGNTSLTGGGIALFNPKAPENEVKVAFDYTTYSFFNLAAVEKSLALQAASGQPVGVPFGKLFTGSFQKQLDALTAKYANLPTQNYTSLTNSTLEFRPEPLTLTQKMYTLLTPIMQAAVTNEHADLKGLLAQAARTFQAQLDQAS
jgi:multiple sugar transport system substrate-binding protein